MLSVYFNYTSCSSTNNMSLSSGFRHCRFACYTHALTNFKLQENYTRSCFITDVNFRMIFCLFLLSKCTWFVIKDSLRLKASHSAKRKYNYFLGSLAFCDNALVIFLTCEARRRISGECLHFLARLHVFHERIVTFQSVIQGSRNFFLWRFVRKISGRIEGR